MITTIFANYGVLAHEKEPAYTIAPHEYAASSEPIPVILPADVRAYRNAADEVIVVLDGAAYLLSEVLTNSGSKPVIRWYNGSGYRTITLTEQTYYLPTEDKWNDAFGPMDPVCVDREEAERLLRGWSIDADRFDEYWTVATHDQVLEYGVYNTEDAQ